MNYVSAYSVTPKLGSLPNTAPRRALTEDELALLMAEDAKGVRSAVQKSQGQTDQNIAGQRRANGEDVNATCKNALLAWFQERPIAIIDDLVNGLQFKRCTVTRGVKLLRLDGYHIISKRGPEGSSYVFHGKGAGQ